MGLEAQVVKKTGFITFPYGNPHVVDHDTVPLNRFDTTDVDHKGFMYAYKLIGGEFVQYFFEAHKGQYGFVGVFDMDFQIIFQALDIFYVIKVYFYAFVFGFYKNEFFRFTNFSC